MGTKAAVTHPRSPPANEREDDDRLTTLAAVGDAVDVLHVLDQALARTSDDELGRLAGDVREAERKLEDWARQLETFRASRQLFESGILPDPVGRPRGIPNELVLAQLGRALDTSPFLRVLWEAALAFVVGFVLSFIFFVT